MSSNGRRIPSAGPSITEKEISYVNDAITNGWYENRSSFIDRFTDSFRQYMDVDYVLPLAHCTDAIHLSLLALGIGPGDEVIVPDLTWVASAAPILYLGATPVFVDVEEETWCMSSESLLSRITDKTKAVIVVDLLGNMADWDKILPICEEFGIPIVEDAAESVGARYRQSLAGSFGQVSVFSFNATKLMMSGQGGVLCTNDQELYELAKRKSHHGIDVNSTGKYFWSTELGYNYNWTNVQAAIALAQLERVDELLATKQRIFDGYLKRLSGSLAGKLNPLSDGVTQPSYWVPTVIFRDELRNGKEGFLQAGTDAGIDFRPMFYPLSSMPTFAKSLSTHVDPEVLSPVSYKLSRQGVSLPSGNSLTEKDLDLVSDFVLGYQRQGDFVN